MTGVYNITCECRKTHRQADAQRQVVRNIPEMWDYSNRTDSQWQNNVLKWNS
jgi:hypothetical protein